MKTLTDEQMDDLEKRLNLLKEEMNGIPHIVIAICGKEDDKTKLWIHQQAEATRTEFMTLMVEFMKHNPKMISIIERAIEWVKITMKHGDKPSAGTIIEEAIKNTMADFKDKGLQDFLKSLSDDLRNAVGGEDDIDKMLKDILNKKDDEEGTEQK